MSLAEASGEKTRETISMAIVDRESKRLQAQKKQWTYRSQKVREGTHTGINSQKKKLIQASESQRRDVDWHQKVRN